MIAVLLDSEYYGKGPATVLAFLKSPSDYFELLKGYPDHFDARVRMWPGNFTKDARVELSEAGDVFKSMSVRHEACDYSGTIVPAHYFCSSCNRKGCKLWRQYQTVASAIDLLCVDCATDEGKKSSYPHKNLNFPETGDQIGSLVPAIPTEDGESYWGYTFPSAGVSWWWRLPPFSKDVPVEPEQPQKPFEFPFKDEEVEGLVQATATEKMDIWKRFRRAVLWEELGYLRSKVGYATDYRGERSGVYCHVEFVRLDGHVIGFWQATSVLVDYDLVKDYLHKTFKGVKTWTDALNIHNCTGPLGIKVHLEKCETCENYY